MENDHDKITQLISSFNDFKMNVNEKFAELKSDIKDLRDGISTRVINLEKTKADRVEVDAIQKKLDEDIEIRVRRLENYKGTIVNNTVLQWGAWGIVLTALMWHIFGQPK